MNPIHDTMHFEGENVIYRNDPTVEEILGWIRKLDGNENTIVSVALKNGNTAEVGGGSDDQYKVNVRVDRKFYNLASGLTDSYERVPIVMSDDLCHFPQKYVVSLDQALKAIQHFCLSSPLSPNFAWSNAEDYYPFEPGVRAKDEPER